MVFTHLSDSALLQKIDSVLGSRRRLTATLLEYLAEVERRRLHLKEAYSSMYDFCVRKLYMGESSAVRHIAAARACSRFPNALELVRQGQLNLTGLELVSRYLTAANHRELLLAASGRRKPEIEAMLRSHFPPSGCARERASGFAAARSCSGARTRQFRERHASCAPFGRTR